MVVINLVRTIRNPWIVVTRTVKVFLEMILHLSHSVAVVKQVSHVMTTMVVE